MKSKEILRIIGMHKQYQCKPSSIIGIEDPYTAYCFDEACAYIIHEIQDGKTPMFKKRYTSASEMYRDMGLS